MGMSDDGEMSQANVARFWGESRSQAEPKYR